MTKLRASHFRTPILMGIACFLSVGALGASRTFHLVPEESSVTLSGQAIGLDIKSQGPGSLTSHFQGTIQAVVADDNIQFVPGSIIDALTNGNWEPLPGGASGSAPADFGGLASSILGSAKASVREVKLDLMSNPIALTNGVFDGSSLIFFFPTNTSSSFDYRFSSFLLQKEGSEPLAGYSTNKIAIGASLITTNGFEILTIPLQAEYFFELLAPGDTKIKLEGKLVARAGGVTAPKIDSITALNQTVTLRWQAESGVSYHVESSPDLKTWTVRESALTSGSPTLTWSTNTSGPIEFFRIGR